MQSQELAQANHKPKRGNTMKGKLFIALGAALVAAVFLLLPVHSFSLFEGLSPPASTPLAAVSEQAVTPSTVPERANQSMAASTAMKFLLFVATALALIRHYRTSARARSPRSHKVNHKPKHRPVLKIGWSARAA